MTAVATSARNSVVSWLGTTYDVQAVAPKSPSPPQLCVVAADPWMTPNAVGGPLRFRMNLKVMCVARDNIEGLTQLETMVEYVMDALNTHVQVSYVTAPATLDIGAQGTVLVSEVHLEIHVKE